MPSFSSFHTFSLTWSRFRFPASRPKFYLPSKTKIEPDVRFILWEMCKSRVNAVLFNVRAPPRMLEISFPRIYFESGLIGSLHLSEKKLLTLSCLVILIDHSKNITDHRETENNAYVKNLGVTNKEHYSMLWYFLERSITKHQVSACKL